MFVLEVLRVKIQKRTGYVTPFLCQSETTQILTLLGDEIYSVEFLESVSYY